MRNPWDKRSVQLQHTIMQWCRRDRNEALFSSNDVFNRRCNCNILLDTYHHFIYHRKNIRIYTFKKKIISIFFKMPDEVNIDIMSTTLNVFLLSKIQVSIKICLNDIPERRPNKRQWTASLVPTCLIFKIQVKGRSLH